MSIHQQALCVTGRYWDHHSFPVGVNLQAFLQGNQITVIHYWSYVLLVYFCQGCKLTIIKDIEKTPQLSCWLSIKGTSSTNKQVTLQASAGLCHPSLSWDTKLCLVISVMLQYSIMQQHSLQGYHCQWRSNCLVTLSRKNMFGSVWLNRKNNPLVGGVIDTPIIVSSCVSLTPACRLPQNNTQQ